ncbi:MAG TPA: tetratricopeptide repeat protein, partial [Candidatus Binatia bacterium]|nr:tetratricopeptide repeat protein [Candidatus Binatia bacterium]
LHLLRQAGSSGANQTNLKQEAHPVNTSRLLLPGCLSAMIFITGCAGVGQQVQAGRTALQTGRPSDAVGHLMRAAELDPNYTTHHKLRMSVLTYLGRAYYETGKDAEALNTLEKAVAKNRDDHLAHLYLGLTRLRYGRPEDSRKEVEGGLEGIHGWLEYIASDSFYGIYWDPGRQIRSDIEKTLAGKLNASELAVAAQRIGRELDQELDRARKDESYSRYGRGGGGGD